MVGIGVIFILFPIIGWVKRKKLLENPLYLKIMMFAIPLPYLAIQLGWIVTEFGRQPWIVYGLMKTSEAVSPVPTHQVFISLGGFILVYSILGLAGFSLITKYAKQ